MNKTVRKLSNPKEETSKLSKEQELELVRRCQKGDNAAFAKLVENYQKRVFSVALSMVKNPEDAMDIAQDSFIKINRYIGNFKGTSSFYTWIYRIVVNMCIDHLRRSGKHMHTDFDERIDHAPNAAVAAPVFGDRQDANPSKNFGRKELAARIRQAVDELPPYHRTVIIMREIEGMSYADMAKMMGVSKGTIMSRLHHARQKLQRSLSEYLEGDMVIQ